MIKCKIIVKDELSAVAYFKMHYPKGFLALLWKNHDNRIVAIRTDIRTRYFLNAKQDCWLQHRFTLWNLRFDHLSRPSWG
jgi:hypothetical protein